MHMPQTTNGLGCFVCISALQKAIRRGMEREAMSFAMEMCMSNKGFFTQTLNRLFVIAHEDIGLADPDAVVFATTTIELCRAQYHTERPGRYGLALGNVIRTLCQAKKSRVGDWFAIQAIERIRRGEAPTVEDWMLDMHTRQGKAMGRGLEHFLDEGIKLVPEPDRPEPYEEEAIALLREKHERGDTRAPKERKRRGGSADDGHHGTLFNGVDDD